MAVNAAFAGSAVSGATQAMAPFVSGAFGLIGTRLQYDYNKKLAEQQNQYNLDMWKMQAEYNSPQAQMQRYAEAGLNPNLVYSNGDPGNMSHAPQMVTPSAPDYSKGMQEMAKAFNLENLRTIIANRKEAQAKARIAELMQFDREDERDVLSRFGELYVYDTNKGQYVYKPADVSVTAPNPRGGRVGDRSTASGLMTRYLGEHDPRMQNLQSQRAYLDPQIWMANYDKRMYPYSFWIGQGTKVVKGVSDLTGMFNPSRYLMPIKRSTRYLAPSGRVYIY